MEKIRYNNKYHKYEKLFCPNLLYPCGRIIYQNFSLETEILLIVLGVRVKLEILQDLDGLSLPDSALGHEGNPRQHSHKVPDH